MSNIFQKKKIETGMFLHQKLKELRTKSKLSLEEISQKTRINKKYLQAIEEGQYQQLPQAFIYRTCILKNYLLALKQDPNPWIKEFKRENKSNEKPSVHPGKVIKQNYFNNTPMIIKGALVCLVIVSVVYYLGRQVKTILEPPQITINSPQDGMLTYENPINITGNTTKDVMIYINGKEIANNERGEFSELVNLNNGVNTLTISAKKKHGKDFTEVRHVILKDKQQFSLRDQQNNKN